MPTTTVRDIEMYFECHGEGPPLLLIAGLGGDSGAWAGLLPALSAERRCLVFDARGVGRTSTTEGPYSTSQLAEDAAGLLEALHVPACDVLGASLGGAVAQELALRYPERVHSLILTSSWARTTPFKRCLLQSWKVIRRRAGVYAYHQQSALWSFTPTFFAAEGDAVRRVAGLVGARHAVQAQGAFEAQVEAAINHDALERLPRIVAPTLVIGGAEDILTPPELSRELAAHIPNARLVLIPNAGHAVFWEQQGAYLQEVLAFLRHGT